MTDHAPTHDHQDPAARLAEFGLRPTRQRLALARLLFDGRERHFTADQLYDEAAGAGANLSLATVYNTLRQFTSVGLLREVSVDATRSWFDTKVDDHHHFFFEEDGRLMDIDPAQMTLGKLPAAPDGSEIKRVDVVIRVAKP
ncbi:iron response transcriptional regulator IrrA [Roseiterribacter gracilis]|uniref:Ferric uptake regulation protein n=1 Tax=Roseiterribacter gracilis TaxID=2812848 RepID=A0A8S8XBR2_9PROT|nr:transcriptional repressor [Rhodospirillales bacterium TMPK1]